MTTYLKKHSTVITLLLILVLATFLRVVKLDTTPSGFHADEASFYVNAVALSETGADEDNVRLPISLSSLIDPKPALYSYFQIPFITTLENQVLASRLPAALMGIASLVVIYLLLLQIISTNVALLMTLILSISPWHIVVSRGTQEVIASFFFMTLSLLCLLLYQKKTSYKKVIAFSVSAFLSMYFYHSAKVLLPLLVFGLSMYSYKKSKDSIKIFITVLGITFLAALFSVLVQESTSRIAAVGILTDEAPMHRLVEKIYTLHGELPVPVVRIFYNKIGAYLGAIAEEYVAYFSPEFLFLEGGKPFRYTVPGHGLLYLIEIPLLLLGLFSAIRSKKKATYLFLGLLLLAPIPAALTTQETPSMIRSFPMVIALAYFIAVGISSIYSARFQYVRHLTLLSIILVYCWQIGYFALQYDVQAYYDTPWYRNSPYSDIAKEVAASSDNYREIRVTNDLRPLYAYFAIENLFDVAELQTQPHARDNAEYRLGKFVFNRGVCDLGSREQGVLYIAETQCRERIEDASSFKVVKTISYQDGTPVYELLEITE